MKQQQKQIGITVFYSYAETDRGLRDQLATHLSQLRRDGLIEEWYDQQILAGADRAQQIDQAIRSAQVILLLISADFLASDAQYQIEMQHALERHKRGEARVVPVIVRPCDWQYSPFAHLQCLPRTGKPISTWDHQDEAFLAIAQELRRIIAHQQFPSPPLSEVQRQNRARLLKRVRTTWIEGLLEHSLHQAAWIDLHLQDQLDALINPWRLQVQELNQEPCALPAGTSIVQVYDEAEGELLILGEPGAGKTTLLLHLARTLLDRAEADERLPIPVVFHLSSWACQHQPLTTWLSDELRTKYQVPRRVAEQWVEGRQILPLLDGLDEVAEEARVACVQAITAYYSRHSNQIGTPLVVCCRSQEYQKLSLHVSLSHAVSILPLTEQQIDAYLSSTQGQLEGLRQALDDDAELAALAHRPLMLSIFALAYQGATAKDFEASSSSQKQTLHAVFSSYVKRMLSRRGQLPLWMQKHLLHWLIWVAKHLHRQQQTIFSLEDLQRDWLPEKRQKLYLWSLRVLGFLFSELVFGLSWLLLGGNLVGYLLVGLFMAVLFSSIFSGEVGKQNGEIWRTDVMSWSWKGVRKNFTGVSVAVLFGGLCLGLTGAQVFLHLPDEPLTRLALALFLVPLLTLLIGGFAMAAYVPSELPLKIHVAPLNEKGNFSPNEGIRRSGRNGLLVGGLCGGLALLICELTNGLSAGLFAGLLIGSLSGLLLGLNAFIQHFILRFWLWRTNCLPWNLIPFLDEAAERLLLRKVGGSYIFVHRLLLDYFATLDEPMSTENTSSNDEV